MGEDNFYLLLLPIRLFVLLLCEEMTIISIGIPLPPFLEFFKIYWIIVERIIDGSKEIFSQNLCEKTCEG